MLQHLSGLVGQFADRIVYDVDALAAIDLALAKAKYAVSMRATAPRLEDGYRLNLIEARHPLLTGNVVPIDVRLGPSGRRGERAAPAGRRTRTTGRGGQSRGAAGESPRSKTRPSSPWSSPAPTPGARRWP